MNIAIVGAGVFGRLLAIHFIEKNTQVTMFDRDGLAVFNSAAFASAGMLCPLGESTHSPSVVSEMGWASLSRWPDILNTIKQLDDQQETVFFQQQGSIATAFPQDEACMKQFVQDLSNFDENAGQFTPLNRNDLKDVEPTLTNFEQGLLLRSEGQLCNRQFLSVTSRVLKKRLNELRVQNVEDVHLNQLQHEFDVVFDCRGFGAVDAHRLGNESRLRGVRGEVIRIHCPDVSLNRPLRIVHPRNSIYIVPKPNHEFVIGATEIETNSAHPITVKSTLELLSTLYCVHPAFGEAQVLETRTGIRAAYEDNIPQVTQHENIIKLNGGYRHGWLVGPALVQQAIQQWEAA